MKAWRPSKSHPYRNVTVTLRSLFTQRVFVIAFHFAQRAVYGIEVLLPIIGTKEQVDVVLERVHALMESLEGELRDKIAMLETLKANEGIEQGLDGYTMVMEETVQTYIPDSRRLIGNVINFDRYCALADELWLAGALSKLRREEVIDVMSRRIRDFATEINKLHERTLRAARSARDARIAAEDFARQNRKKVRDDARTAAAGEAANSAQILDEVEAAREKLRHEQEEATLAAELSVSEDFVAAAVEEDTTSDALGQFDGASSAAVLEHDAAADQAPAVDPVSAPAEVTPRIVSKRPSRTLNSAAIG